MGLNPTPLPIVDLHQIRNGDGEESQTKTAESMENVLVFLERIREVLFDSSTTDSLAAQIQELMTRPKDIYTFPIPFPTVSGGEGGKDYAAIPLDAAHDGVVTELYARIRKDTGRTVLQVKVDGVVWGTMSVGDGAMSAQILAFDEDTGRDLRRFPNRNKVNRKQSIFVSIVEAPEEATDTDLVVQVMVR